MTVTATRLAFFVLLLSILVAVLRGPARSEYTFNGLKRNYYSQPNDVTTSNPDKERILLVTAHPDDECLFFGPTLLGLTSNASNLQNGENERANIPEIFSFCLSVGDADGLGPVRREEYEKSLDILGVPKGNRMVLDHPDLRDDIRTRWKPEVIAEAVKPFAQEHRITTILTFDREGISQHPNHQSIPYGIRHLISTWPSDSESLQTKPRLFTLITVPLSIKYISVLAPLLAKYDLYSAEVLHYFEDQLVRLVGLVRSFRSLAVANTFDSVSSQATETRPADGSRNRNPNPMPVFVSGTREYFIALKAMKEHWSQLVWFRWLNVMFSRYMWVNEWVEVKM